MAEERTSSTGRFSAKQVMLGVLALIVLILAIVNFESTPIDLVFFTVTMPLFFVIVGSALIGWLVGRLAGGRRRRDD